MRMSYIQYSYDHTTILGFSPAGLTGLRRATSIAYHRGFSCGQEQRGVYFFPATLSSFRKSTIWLVI